MKVEQHKVSGVRVVRKRMELDDGTPFYTIELFIKHPSGEDTVLLFSDEQFQITGNIAPLHEGEK